MCDNSNSKNGKIAQLAVVHAITRHLHAKNIVVASILNKRVVMRKNDVKLGDRVIIIKENSILPRNKKWSKFHYDWYGNSRVLPHKFLKIQSDCIALPVKSFSEFIVSGGTVKTKKGNVVIKTGDDVSQIIGVERYIPKK